MSNGVIAVEKSSNAKIGNVSTTYTSQTSCPKSCPFMGSGCYAESGMVGMHTRKLNKSTLTAMELAKEEASAIRSLSGKRPLRIHVVGDCTNDTIAKTVSSAAMDYTSKHSSPVWSYTHAHRTVKRASWAGVSVLASCESVPDAKRAMARGYAAAIVVEKHLDTKAYMQDGVKLLPCPQQTGKSASCETCKLCWNDQHLLSTKTVIAFETHSQGFKKANEALVQIGV